MLPWSIYNLRTWGTWHHREGEINSGLHLLPRKWVLLPIIVIDPPGLSHGISTAGNLALLCVNIVIRITIKDTAHTLSLLVVVPAYLISERYVVRVSTQW